MDSIPSALESEINALEKEIAHVRELPSVPKSIVSALRERVAKLKLRKR